jgi:hypothetical protein
VPHIATHAERPEQFSFRLTQVEPRRPNPRALADHLPIVIRLNVFTRFGREHREGRRLIALAFLPNARNRHEQRVVRREAVLGFRIFLAGKFEECRCRYQTAVRLSEATPVRTGDTSCIISVFNRQRHIDLRKQGYRARCLRL